VAWLAQYMESHGVEVDLRDHCGHSPLHLAARAGHASAVAILVAHGADVTAKVFLFSFFFQPIFELSFIFPISHPPQKSCRLSSFLKRNSIIQIRIGFYLLRFSFLF
jgi:ankyrin repeat protein